MIPPPADSTTGDMDVSIVTLLRPMEFSIKLHTVKPGWSVVCFCLFVALRPNSTAMVMAGRSVHLTTLFPGQA